MRRREPAVEAAFAALAQACGEEACGEKACSPRLTGTGSGCFVEFADRGSAEAALAALPSSLRAWLAAGADVSPLFAALEAYRLQGRRQEA